VLTLAESIIDSFAVFFSGGIDSGDFSVRQNFVGIRTEQWLG
jgi:hypothetical protein